MDIHQVIEYLEDSAEYKKFIEENPDHYLVHMFTIMDDAKHEEWQIGYYGKEDDKIVVFDVTESTIKLTSPQEAFKEENYIEKLDIDQIKIKKNDAIDVADQIINKNYSAESLVRMIMLLQNLPGYGQLWNITIVTQTFSVINIKINASTGEVIKHSRESLMGWNKQGV